MAHTAAVYTVTVREKFNRDGKLEFGALNDAGAYLGSVLQEIFDDDFISVGEKTEKEVSCSSSVLDEEAEELRLVLHHGEAGLAARILDANGDERLRQKPEDTQEVRCGALFRLPRNQKIGWLAVHLNGNRGVKQLLVNEMTRKFVDRFPELMLEVRPCVIGKVLEEALAEGRLKAVKLVKIDKPADIADAEKWVAQDTKARIELRIGTVEKGKRLLPDLVKKLIDGSTTAFGRIVQFDGIDFDQAKVEVDIDAGSKQRTFNLQNLEAGHPFTADIEPELEDGEPKDESVFAELATVIDETTE